MRIVDDRDSQFLCVGGSHITCPLRIDFCDIESIVNLVKETFVEQDSLKMQK
jgi:hypothetical protein